MLWVASVGVVVGCSGAKPVDPAPADVAVVPTAPGAPVAAAPTVPVATAADPAKPETKWIGNIPFDVFYDQPLTIASDATPIGGGPPSVSPTPGDVAMTKPNDPATPTEATPAAAPAASGKPDWAKVIPVELAIEVVKIARSDINANIQTVPKYNAGMEAIRTNAALIGMMSIIVAEHSEKANWQAKAKFVRDLTYAIQGKATEKGSAGHKATQELFEQVTTILDGGPPANKEAADSVPYVEVADRAEMMKIIEKTVNDLKSNIGDPKRMKDQADPVTRQLSMLAALGTMMLDASYEHADNPEYIGYSNAFIDGAKASLESVKTDRFDGFTSGLSKMNTACGDCHPKFKEGDGG